ncbi:MAG: thiamine-binding protein [Bacteroidales bacterium]|nr:thiamine-binding protein [Bacteroidales bacterium]MDY0142459.1 thiamine-binding protein [Bacteroidales bacterium]
MSVLMNYAMFPTDKGDSVSEFVSKIIKMIYESGYDYKLNAMGTIVETENIEQALEIVNKSYKILEPFSDRVYATISFDIQTNKPTGRLEGKVKSIEDKM